MTKDEALQMCLEYIETDAHESKYVRHAIKAALEAKDEPVAWISPTELLVMRGNALGGAKDWRVNVGLKPEDGDVGLYTTPPQRTWVGLTDEEIQELRYKIDSTAHWTYGEFAKAIEAKLKEKNNGQ
jgi:hypothetical protein